MVTSNVLQRVIYIRFRDSTGTAFTIEQDGRQYIVTARHVIEGLTNQDTISIFFNRSWNDINVRLVGAGDKRQIECDIAVVAADHQITPILPMPVSSNGVYLA